MTNKKKILSCGLSNYIKPLIIYYTQTIIQVSVSPVFLDHLKGTDSKSYSKESRDVAESLGATQQPIKNYADLNIKINLVWDMFQALMKVPRYEFGSLPFVKVLKKTTKNHGRRSLTQALPNFELNFIWTWVSNL